MGRIDYQRLDVPLRIAPLPNGGAEIGSDGADGTPPWRVRLTTLDLTALRYRLQRHRPVPDRFRAPQAFLSSLQSLARANPALPHPQTGVVSLLRLVLRVAGPLSGYAWEPLVSAMLGDEFRALPLVRESAVWPRVAARRFTLPLRMLQVDPVGKRIEDSVTFWLHNFAAEERAHAVVAGTASLAQLLAQARFADWPTADVLHFDRLPSSRETPRLGISVAPAVGSATWLCRLSEINQTRLIVLRTDQTARTTGLRRLAQRVTDQGGPAVLVVAGGPEAAAAWHDAFYGALIHDTPLDLAVAQAWSAAPAVGCALWVGGGREELLRVSSAGVGLLAQNQAWPYEPSNTGHHLVNLRLRREGGRPDLQLPPPFTPASRAFEAHLDGLRVEWPQYRFDRSEGGGLMPLARRLRSMREVLVAAPAAEPHPLPEPRHMHCLLWPATHPPATKPLASEGTRLRIGVPVQLELQIAPGKAVMHMVDDAALIEEQFHWVEGEDGRWLDVGLTPLDFEVLGAPVQGLWLPRTGSSDALRFTVTPRRAGVALLRWTLYQGNDVLRSYRLGALVLDTDGGGDPADPAQDLAGALGVTPEQAQGQSYLVRLEYSLAPSFHGLPERAEPILSLLANDLQGRTVITLKSGSVFEVAVPAQAKDYVQASRLALAEIEMPPVRNLPRERWPYPFGADNSGSESQLAAALQRLAQHGAELFNQLIPGDVEQKDLLRQALDREPGTIHVAHVLLQHVIPWALVYDREYDEVPGKDAQGRTVAQAVCMAPVRAGFGQVPCGKHDQCVLHVARLQERLARDCSVLSPASVVCPRHFWGFQHVIEIPPQQVEATGEGTPLARSVQAGEVVQMLRALNQTLSLVQRHESELNGLVQDSRAGASWAVTAYERNAVKDGLGDLTLDIIYFYCHAEGGAAANTAVPQLIFGKPPLSLAPRHLQGRAWPHRPLVFLNGCGTLAYSPDALSPFIDTLVRDRRAAGVLGTEIPIREVLATEVARLFLAAFIGGQAAGMALQQVRLDLLKKNNPLGLAYTLYAAAELGLERAQHPSPQQP